MKPVRYKKVLGLSIGERSMLVAEVVAMGDQPDVRTLAELTYPPNVSLERPAELGQALSQLLREKKFSATAAVVGLPAKWIIASPKDLPAGANDAATKTNILRLSAEAEFSADLKDLVSDYVDAGQSAALLTATPSRYVDAAVEMCRAAKLTLIAVTPAAVALGEATSRALPAAEDALVLAISSSGAELTAQRDAAPSALRHLRATSTASPAGFVSELRRAVSTLPRPGRSTARRELVLWDGSGLDVNEIGTQLGVNIRSGDLPALGVSASGASRNGAGRAYASAVALTLPALRGQRSAVDFLHSRLAPPKPRLVPQWAYLVTIIAILLILGGVWAYRDLQRQQADLDKQTSRLTTMQPEFSAAESFVARVSFAQAWHNADPRYLACLRDLTSAIPDDGQTYATSLIVREAAPIKSSTPAAPSSPASAKKPIEQRLLQGQLYGKTSDQQHVQIVLDHLKQISEFTNVKFGGTQDAGRGREVSFSITFDYLPPK